MTLQHVQEKIIEAERRLAAVAKEPECLEHHVANALLQYYRYQARQYQNAGVVQIGKSNP